MACCRVHRADSRCAFFVFWHAVLHIISPSLIVEMLFYCDALMYIY